MDIRLLNNAEVIRDEFMSHFVMSWEEFQSRRKDWIAKMAERSYVIDMEWYKQSYMWDRMNPGLRCVSMDKALAVLREHSGRVLFMFELGENAYYQGERIVNFAAETEAKALAAEIEREWFDSYKLAAQNMYDPDAFLQEDLYVFDSTMKWCVVFTHETTDWESEIDEPMKAAESRVCFICEL